MLESFSLASSSENRVLEQMPFTSLSTVTINRPCLVSSSPLRCCGRHQRWAKLPWLHKLWAPDLVQQAPHRVQRSSASSAGSVGWRYAIATAYTWATIVSMASRYHFAARVHGRGVGPGSESLCGGVGSGTFRNLAKVKALRHLFKRHMQIPLKNNLLFFDFAWCLRKDPFFVHFWKL